MITRTRIVWPKGTLWNYYFRLRRRGFTPRESRNVTWTHAQAVEIGHPESAREHLSAYYARRDCYSGD